MPTRKRNAKLDSLPPSGNNSSRLELAKLIVAIMAHPLTPYRLNNDIADYICDESSPVWAELEKQPAFIARVLAQGTCGYLFCPGGGCKGECTRTSNKELKRKRGAKG